MAIETYEVVRSKESVPGFMTFVIVNCSVRFVPDNCKSDGNEIEIIHGWTRIPTTEPALWKAFAQFSSVSIRGKSRSWAKPSQRGKQILGLGSMIGDCSKVERCHMQQ
jgi:hypothetical protein